jgi:hypothetical protein
MNSDNRQYGTMKVTMAASFTYGHDEYPDTLDKAIGYLDTHKLDIALKEYTKKRQHDSKDDRKGKPSCKPEANFNQKASGGQVCFCCGDPSHKSPDCPYAKKVDKSQWYSKTKKVPSIAKKAFAQAHDDDDSDSDNSTIASAASTKSRSSNHRSDDSSHKSRKSSSSIGWQGKKGKQGFMYGTCLTQNGNGDSEEDLKDVILLDTGSTIGATIANPDLITNLKATSSPLQMATNAGTKTLNLKGDVIGFGKAWYDPDFMANIFRFAKMAEQHRITYDSNIEDAFLVHTEDGDVLKFERTSEGLYAYRPPKEFLDSVARTKIKPARKQNFVSTVKENLEGFTKREVDDAMVARKLYHTSGCPTVDNLKMMIWMNQIKNCPVTSGQPKDDDLDESNQELPSDYNRCHRCN